VIELDQAPAATEAADRPSADEQRPGSGDSQRYPNGVTAADTDPGYYDGDIKAALAADTTPIRQQAGRDDTSGHRASADATTSSRDVPASGHDPDIEAILRENDHLPGPRTRQEAARDDGGDRHERLGPDPLGEVVGNDGPATRRASDELRADHGDERVDVAARYPADYVPSDRSAPNIDGPYQAPETWIDGVNPEHEKPGRNNNCGECSRAVDSTWGGEPRVAAALADRDVGGEPIGRMTDWANTPPVKASMAEVGQRLTELGPGSSAVVGCDWKIGGGHWFNAVNYDGIVKAVDGQSGHVENWPPSANGLGFDESSMRWSDAIFFTADRKVVSE
jgi:hypothetical protein